MPSVEAVGQNEDGLRNDALQEEADSERRLPHSVTHGMAPVSSAWLPLGVREGWQQWVS